jgi:UDP-N-acetylglucosamine--N-acetylmuramyl-(pentapeptide) pyrophosphoryl-undecaprenol N-acetylglucosamine transferase
MEKELIRRFGIPFKGIPAAGVHGVGLARLPGNIIQLLQGISRSRQIVKDFRPDCVLFTGGYVAVPMAIAARRYPSVLFVPDIEPGLALKFLSRNAKMIALSAEDSKPYFDNRPNLKVTGYPIRNDLRGWTKEKALKVMHLNSSEPVLLILGGSKGARSINRSVMTVLEELLSKWQIIHVTGQLDWKEIEVNSQKLAAKLRSRYHAYPYLHEEMGAALASANLVVSRAGASTLGEYPDFGLPAILVPYPYAWRYQKVNADYLVKNKAALMIRDENLSTELLPAITKLAKDPKKMASMQKAMKKLATPQAAHEIADLVLDLAGKTLGGRP